MAALYRRIYAVVRRIPPGAVATYGQVAQLAGIPRGGRVAGAAMRASPPELGLPWHRVVGRRSRTAAAIAIRDPVAAARQRQLLEAEGVAFRRSGTISLADHGWLPPDA
ncbi:MAG: methyltransferase [Deltaproteobacteria bacterium]|nr:MAG: methyltransferase [Deltaproteobacteria bacterium]